LNSLKNTIGQQLKAAQKVHTHLTNPDAVLEVVDNYWKAVREQFPEAWHNNRDYILLQAIGLGAFAKFGGSLLTTGFESERVEQRDFELALKPVKEKVKLERTEYRGIAGAGGADYILEKLLRASEPDAVKAERITEKLLGKKSPGSKIDDVLGISENLDGQ
jgi:hypothetical protein